MEDRPISVTVSGAATLWLFAVVLAAVYALADVRGTAVFSVLCTGGGATLTVRAFLVRLARCLTERERQAFDLGRESVLRLRP